jgi:uncharacterized protein with HEPN domain
VSAKREPRLRLQDMLDAIDKIEARSGDSLAAFMHDEMLQVWALYHLEVIGEASIHVPDVIKVDNPDVKWSGIAATRNLLAHDYFQVDLEMAWEMIVGDMPVLRAQVTRILAEFD